MAEIRLNRDRIQQFADLSQDHNPLHVDEEHARSSTFGGIIAHGFLLLGGPLRELIKRGKFPKTLECSFKAPGRLDDIIHTDITEDKDQELGFRIISKGREKKELVSGVIHWSE